MSIFKIDSKVTLDAINRRNENTIASYIGIEVYEIGEDFIKLLLEAKSEQEGVEKISYLAKELALGVREGR